MTSIGYLKKYIRHRLTTLKPSVLLGHMSFALHRVTNAWNDYRGDPCAKTMLVLARLLSQHQYDPKWPCHGWIQSGDWQTTPWQARLHSALLSSLRTSSFANLGHTDILFTRLCHVAKWPEERKSLKNIVAADAWCPLEWWVLGHWLDKKQETVDTMPELVAMWNPVWALAAPIYAPLGWRQGLKALYTNINYQNGNADDKIDGSTCWAVD